MMMMMLLLVLLLLMMMIMMVDDDDDDEEEEEPDGMTSRSQARPAIQVPAQTRGGCPIAALCSKATFRAAVTRLLQCLRLQSPRHERFSAPCRATAFFSHTRLHSTDAPSNRPRFGPEIAPALLRTCRLFFRDEGALATVSCTCCQQLSEIKAHTRRNTDPTFATPGPTILLKTRGFAPGNGFIMFYPRLDEPIRG